MDKPSHWVTFFNYISNPTFGFVRISVKTTQHVLESIYQITDMASEKARWEFKSAFQIFRNE